MFKANHFGAQSKNHSLPPEEVITFSRTSLKGIRSRFCALLIILISRTGFSLYNAMPSVGRMSTPCTHPVGCYRLLVTFFFSQPSRSVAEVKRQSANSFWDGHTFSLHVEPIKVSIGEVMMSRYFLVFLRSIIIL